MTCSSRAELYRPVIWPTSCSERRWLPVYDRQARYVGVLARASRAAANSNDHDRKDVPVKRHIALSEIRTFCANPSGIQFLSTYDVYFASFPLFPRWLPRSIILAQISDIYPASDSAISDRDFIWNDIAGDSLEARSAINVVTLKP